MDSSYLIPPAKRSYDWEPSEANGREKRRPSATSWGPPPLKIGPDETIFRILCNGSKTGGVIGKGGSIVKQIRQETGAKIRIEEGVPGCDERVVVIVAPEKEKKEGKEENVVAESNTQIKEDANEDTDEKEQDETEADEKAPETDKEAKKEKALAPAQEALLRVLHRILEGESDAKTDEDADKKTAPVIARLLVPTNQVGCVLGKGGKIIQQIRAESGAQIRILSREQLPACALPTDEVVQITGDVASVKKALLSVSDRLRENPPRDRDHMPASRSGGPFAHGDLFPSRKSSSLVQGLPFGGVGSGATVDYHLKGPVSKFHEAGPNYNQRGPMQEEITFRLLCSNEKVGGIIGKGGSIIKGLQRDTGSDIKIAESVPDEDERVVIITASAFSEGGLSPVQNAVLRVFNRIISSVPEKDKHSTARLLVPSNQIGCLLGKGGSIISDMRRASGAGIRIFGKDQLPKCASQNDEVVQVTGDPEAVQEALVQITSRLQNNLFPGNTGPIGGVGMYPEPMAPVPGPIAQYRGRPEPASPPGMYSRLGGSMQDMDQSGRLPPTVDRPGFPPSIHRPGGMPHNIDQPPSPGPWAMQGMNSGSGRNITDYGRGYPQRGSLGSGSQSAVVTSTTVEVVVPERVIGSIYGENGSNLAQIRKISGAKVIMHDPRPGATEGLVVISGTPEQTHAAQSLLQAFIMSGQSSP
ncbi:KH domain-containing protein HEN4 [Cryptomeria japonica]|uniref:KH domain-containing protein HEN4 n=1 Tax=Cryptomeria japonica TaxID=3369 RepID=UPI0025ACFAF4|nr:KH domain-containing protein HEN4 [Cryptomeria japonica]XP_057871158.1 KH domain-containing protein HEN4 [Cryptomeria japonica]